MVIVAGSSRRIGPDVEFYSELLGQIVLFLHQRSYIGEPAGKLDGLLAVDGHDLTLLAAQEIPVKRELSKFLPLHRIIEKYLVARNKVGLGVGRGNLFFLLHIFLGLCRRLPCRLLCLLLHYGLLLLRGRGLLLRFLLIAEDFVEGVVHALLHFLAHLVLGCIFGPVAEITKNLCVCAAA